MKPGIIIKTRRLELGLSQVDLAISSKTTQSSIAAIERGYRPIGEIVGMRIAEALKIPVSNLNLETQPRAKRLAEHKDAIYQHLANKIKHLLKENKALKSKLKELST